MKFRWFGSSGLGRDQTGPFEVHAIVDSEALNLNMVGYGGSQSQPIIAELLNRPTGGWVAIQQSQVHLHPLGQRQLEMSFSNSLSPIASVSYLDTKRLWN